MDRLPDEILVNIFESIPVRLFNVEYHRSMARLSAACRKLRRVYNYVKSSSHVRVRDLDLTDMAEMLKYVHSGVFERIVMPYVIDNGLLPQLYLCSLYSNVNKDRAENDLTVIKYWSEKVNATLGGHRYHDMCMMNKIESLSRVLPVNSVYRVLRDVHTITDSQLNIIIGMIFESRDASKTRGLYVTLLRRQYETNRDKTLNEWDYDSMYSERMINITIHTFITCNKNESFSVFVKTLLEEFRERPELMERVTDMYKNVVTDVREAEMVWDMMVGDAMKNCPSRRELRLWFWSVLTQDIRNHLVERPDAEWDVYTDYRKRRIEDVYDTLT